ncbi:MAG: hypothetical protein WC205_05415 [Opitutaceae bacterium]
MTVPRSGRAQLKLTGVNFIGAYPDDSRVQTNRAFDAGRRLIMADYGFLAFLGAGLTEDAMNLDWVF